MKFWKPLIAVSALMFLASCGWSEQVVKTEKTTNTTKTISAETNKVTETATPTTSTVETDTRENTITPTTKEVVEMDTETATAISDANKDTFHNDPVDINTDAIVEDTEGLMVEPSEPVEDIVIDRNVTYKAPSGDVSVTIQMEGWNKWTPITKLDVKLNSAKDDMMTPKMVESFNKEAQTLIVGKTLSEIEGLDAVGGASLTTEAFKEFAKGIS